MFGKKRHYGTNADIFYAHGVMLINLRNSMLSCEVGDDG